MGRSELDAFCFRLLFGGETNDGHETNESTEQRRAKECGRNFVDYVNCDGFVHQFISCFFFASLFLSCVMVLGLA